MSSLDLRPLDAAPVSIRGPFDLRWAAVRDVEGRRLDYVTALRESLASIPLGAYYERMLTRLASLDVLTVGTVASLLHRARTARPLAGAR